MEKNSFILYNDCYEEIKLLTMEQRGLLLTALFEYVNNKTDLETDDVALKIVFSTIRRTVDRDTEKYEAKCRKNSENGGKGGRPPKNRTDSENTERFSAKPKKADNDNVPDNDTVPDNVNEPDNEIVLPSGELGADAPAPQHTKKKSTRFIPPTVEEVRDYCKELNKYIDAERFVDYYTANGWKVGRNAMRDWQATVRNWCKNDKSGGTFIDEGHDLDEIFGGS